MAQGTVVVCTCAKYKHIDLEEAKKTIASLQAQGENVFVTADFCTLATDGREQLHSLAVRALCACHQRAQKALCRYAGLDCNQFYNLCSDKAQQIAEQMQIPFDDSLSTEGVELPAYEDKLVAWYPTIDEDRCVNCMKCVNFCMFGVYKKDMEAGRPLVEKPKNCKTDCPACARVCPEGAIIFPKHPEPPINGGEGGNQGDLTEQKALIDKDLYVKLAARRELARKIKLFNNQ